MHIKDAARNENKQVSISGWVYRKRESGGIVFIIVRDASGVLQTAIKKDNVGAKSWKDANEATIESSVKISGIMKKEGRAPTGYELEASSFKNIHVSEPFPITEYQSAELLLDKRHLWLRSRRMTQIMRARAHVFKYTREFLDKNKFYEITPPVITLAGGETGADLFEVNFFGKKAYLTESSQLYAESMIFSLEKVYSFVPAFRAEKSRTTKHIAELWMVEPEMAYFTQKQNEKVQERLVSYIANKLAQKDGDILDELKVEKKALLSVKPPFKKIKYEEAIEMLNGKGEKLKWGDDFGVPEEKLLTENEEKPIFITDWPKEIKAFYAVVNPKDERTVMAADMQAPHGHGELTSSSEREWRLDKVLERIKEVERTGGIKFNMENYSWWLDLRRYGSVPHAGFGLGMERLIKWLLNLDHIRDAIPFPRMINRAYP